MSDIQKLCNYVWEQAREIEESHTVPGESGIRDPEIRAEVDEMRETVRRVERSKGNLT